MTNNPIERNETEVVGAEGAIASNLFNRRPLEVKRRRWHMPEQLKAWIALLPALFFLIVFMIYPILNTVMISFMENFTWVGGSGTSLAIVNFIMAVENPRITTPYISFQNYITVLGDPTFLRALGNTALIVIVSVPLTIIISLLIAVCLNAIKPLQGLYQTIFFLPYVTNSIALGMVFNIMFGSGSGGLINVLFAGGTPIKWLTVDAGRWNMFLVIVVYSIWNGLAFKILVFMSGLATIDKQYYDAARIDGAKKSKIFARITVPLLSPQILYITITSFIGAFKSYTQIISLFGNGAYDFGGADQKEWMTVVGYVYSNMNTFTGRAAAGSLVLLMIILAITLVQMLVSKSRVHY